MKILKLDNSFFSWEKIGYLQLPNLHIITFCFHSDSLTWRSNQKKRILSLRCTMEIQQRESFNISTSKQRHYRSISSAPAPPTHPPPTKFFSYRFGVNIFSKHLLLFFFFFFLIGKVNPYLIYL